jgi:hypothetical protein
MLLFKTSFNLRSDLPWEKVYNECIYPWLDNSKNRKTNEKNYTILRKLPKSLDLKKAPTGKYEETGEILEYNSFSYDKHEYFGFSFSVQKDLKTWRTRFALKRTNKHVICFIVHDCEIGKGSQFPPINKPKIIDYLAKFQEDDGSIELTDKPHFLSASDVNEAVRIFNGKTGNSLPIVYLSSTEHFHHAIKPSVLAKKLFGVAHVFAEREHIYERVQIDVKTRFPQKGEIAICYSGEKLQIINRNDKSSWEKDPSALVQDFFLNILKRSLTTRFDFSWEDYLDQKRDFKLEKQHEELKSLSLQTKEATDAVSKLIKEKQKLQSELNSKQSEIERLSQTLKDYKNEYESFERIYEDENKQLKELLHNAKTAKETLQRSLDFQKNQEGQYISLLLPKDPEMYPNEFLCHLMALIEKGLKNAPSKTNSNKIRTKDILENLHKANPEAVKIFEKAKQNRTKLEKAAKDEAIHKPANQDLLKPFNLKYEKKSNNHYKISFQKDKQENYLATESSSGSDKRGGKNEATDLAKAFFWSD